MLNVTRFVILCLFLWKCTEALIDDSEFVIGNYDHNDFDEDVEGNDTNSLVLDPSLDPAEGKINIKKAKSNIDGQFFMDF